MSQQRPIRCAIVVLNYSTPKLTIECLESLAPQMAELDGVQVVVVDNKSPDDSAERIAKAMADRGWSWARLVRSPVNAGFAGGNNAGIEAVDARAYILLNSDTIVRPCAIKTLLDASDRFPDAGVIGPQLEWPDEEPQECAFRFRTPRTEMLGAAGTGAITSLFGGTLVAIEPHDTAFEAQWISFACALIRREVIDRVGLLDDDYFMYFEDMDLCRRARRAGFRVLCWPQARVVHLRGGSSNVKEETARQGRRPAYYYESRSRYFATFYGRHGFWLTNVLWGLGKVVSVSRELVGTKPSHSCEREWRDNWTNWRAPLSTRRAA